MKRNYSLLIVGFLALAATLGCERTDPNEMRVPDQYDRDVPGEQTTPRSDERPSNRDDDF